MAADTPIRPTSSKVVYQNPWITIHENQTVDTENKQGIYAYMESRDSVAIIALNDKKEIYLQKAYRYPSKTWGWEIPGGGGDDEDVLVASKRELEEETGILAKSWQILGSTIVCNGLMTEKQTTCVAYNLSFDGLKEANASEVFNEHKFVSFKEATGMIAHGEINDNQTITGIYLAEKWLESKPGFHLL